MGKNFKLMLALIIAIFTLPVLGSTVFAAEGSQFEDGEYEVDYTVTFEGVSYDRFFIKPAILKVENGSETIQFGHTDSNVIKEVNVQDSIVRVVSDDDVNLTRVVEFDVNSDLTQPVILNLKMAYGGDHNMQANFDVSKVPTKTENPESGEQPEETPTPPVQEQPEGNTENDDSIINEDGYFTMKFAALHATQNKPSAMAKFMADSVFVSSQNGKVQLTFALADENVVQLLVNGNDAVAEKVEGATRYETFEFDSVPSTLSAKVDYRAPFNGTVFESKADFKIVLDETSQTAATAANKYDAKYVPVSMTFPGKDNGQQTEKPVNNDKATNNTKNETTKTKTETTQPTIVEESKQLIPDKAYSMNYIVKHATQDQESAANQFFKKPAVLLTKNGVNYLQLTITNWSMVDSLSTAYGEVAVVKVNSDGSAVVQLRVNGDLADPIKLDMHITVPGMYSMQHSARLFLDVDSKTEISTGSHEIAAASNGNGVVVNPQTGENTNILLYVLLLIGSGIPLAMLVKRRFA